MPSPPPLSPTPRRWRSSQPDQPHPDFAHLLSTYEGSSSSSDNAQGWTTPRSRLDDAPASNAAFSRHDNDDDDEAEVEFLTATGSPEKSRPSSMHLGSQRSTGTPEIRTTSPSPQRPTSPSHATEKTLSPLLPPDRGQLFGDDTSSTIGRNTLTRGFGSSGSITGPRGMDLFRTQQTFNDTPPTLHPPPSIETFPAGASTFPVPPQITGQSTATIDAAYDGVLSQLDALANPNAFLPTTQQSIAPTTPPAIQKSDPISTTWQPPPIRQPLVGLGIRLGGSGDGQFMPGDFPMSRLSTVTERTERSTESPASSRRSPSSIRGPREYSRMDNASSVAGRFPLPPSPIKGPRAAGTPQGTPKKTSDLIKMFESRSTVGPSEPPAPQPQFIPSTPSRTTTAAASATPAAQRLESVFNPPPPSYTAPQLHSLDSSITLTPPRKTPSPFSVRGMVASWRARSGSPTQRVAGSPGKGGDGPRLFGRGGDRGWNVSIRRRKRHEHDLAESRVEPAESGQDQQPSEPVPGTPLSQEQHDNEEQLETAEDKGKGKEEDGKSASRSGSMKSDKKVGSEIKTLAGEPIRTGSLYYLNVHDENDRPNWRWIQVDGRLYQEGIELEWMTSHGSRPYVMLDLEFCDEVASTYSPNNPMARDDIGAAAARRQGELADNLYPFKLVYDDGVERLACDSARDRVRWVNAIWTVLERTRANTTAPHLSSLRANRSTSDHEGSEGGGSSSTHYMPADNASSVASPLAPSPHALYTTDDAVITTSGGLQAPIIQRGSRRLAAGGLERGRSLRRVASEADLSDAASIPPPIPEKELPSPSTTTAIQDIPLTADTAERPISRDFTFAYGIRPPTLRSDSDRPFLSPSGGLSSFRSALAGEPTPATTYHTLAGDPTPSTTYHTFEQSSTHQTASPAGTAQTLSMTTTAAITAPQGTSMYTVHATGQTPMSTARSLPSETTARTAAPGSLTPQGTAQPFTASVSIHTAPLTSATAATDAVSSSASSYTARQDTHTAYTSARDIPTSASERTAMPPSTPAGTARDLPTSTSAHTALAPSTPAYTARDLPTTASAYTALAPTTPAGTVQQFTTTVSMHTGEQMTQTPMTTARDVSAPAYTAQEGGTPTIPRVAVTGASPSAHGSVDASQMMRSTVYTTAQETYSGLTAPTQPFTSAMGQSTHPYDTPHSTGGGMLGSPFQTPPPPTERSLSRQSGHSKKTSVSATTYQSAPPPVPSRDSHYSTASSGPQSTKAPSSVPSSPMRYQLHDAPVPSYAESVRAPSTASFAHVTPTEGPTQSYGTALQPPTHYATVDDSEHRSSYGTRPPSTRWATAVTDPRSVMTMATVPTSPSRSLRSSEWDTAPPPPISRSASSDDLSSSRLTDGLSDRRASRAWTQISHPDEDDELLNDLERRSSTGSNISRKPKSRKSVYASAYEPEKSMWTAQTHGDDKSGRTPLGTARENTMYNTARESAYTNAPSWQTQSTYMTTAFPGTGSYFTGRTAQTAPIRAEAPPSTQETTPQPTAIPTSVAPATLPLPDSVSTASSLPNSSKGKRVPVPQYPPPPSPSFPSSVDGTTPTPSTPTWTESSREVGTTHDTNRLLNFLQGQEQAKQGQTTRIGNQLDRIERKVGQIAENQALLAERERPPPVPSKGDDDDSPPPSPSSSTSSSSSTETARPVTPPPLILPEVINQQFDDIRSLLGTLLGRQEDMAQEMSRRRSFEVELPDRGPGLTRLEDLLKRVLQRVGDSEFVDDSSRRTKAGSEKMYPFSQPQTPRTEGTRDGSMYGGADSVYSGDFNPRGRAAPANSLSSEYERRRRGPLGDLPESLLEGSLGEPDFDDEFALAGLPPDTPPSEYVPRKTGIPPHLARRTPRQPPQQSLQPQLQPLPPQQPQPQHEYADQQPREEYQEPEEEYEPEPEPEPEYEDDPEPEPQTEYEPTPQPTPVPPPKELSPPTPVHPPIPYRSDEEQYADEVPYEDDYPEREEYNRGPTPQPVNLPTPVNSPRNQPQFMPQPNMQMPMRPPFSSGGMPPPSPGMTDMPRPSLPRIAGVRDPISTTYYRRGFPPQGPMGMPGMGMGMFPGPIGVPGPGMGPFMPGLRPGLNGFGGPIGPTVNPSLRRPGFFPPGVTSTTGDYGLPAAARYGNAQVPPTGPGLGPPGRPPSGNTTTSDTGLGNTTTESTVTTPSVTTEEIMTPHGPSEHLQEPMEIPHMPHSAAETDDSFRRTLGNAQAIAEAQGEQQNEMSRYLHGMSDQSADGTLAAQNQLAEILGDISRLREQLKPKRLQARVLPDGTVMLDNGDILDGIRGAPAPVPMGAPPPPPPPKTASHVEGKILPDGTVMAGGKIVDGIRAAPAVPAALAPAIPMEPEATPEQLKDMAQDRKLAELQDKISELMQRTKPRSANGMPAPETVLDEDEEISIKATPGIQPTAIGPNTDITREKTVIKEREIIREGPSGKHKEVEHENEIERDTLTEQPAPAPGVVSGSHGTSDQPMSEHPAPATAPLSAPVTASVQPEQTVVSTPVTAVPTPTAAPSSTRLNPRTGKPIILPPPLSHRTASPIQPEYPGGLAPGTLIREETEEIVSHPSGGGPPTHTVTTTRTYTGPPPVNGAGGSMADPGAGTTGPGAPTVPAPNSIIPPTEYGDQPVVPATSHHPSAMRPGTRFSDHQATSEHGLPNIPSHHSTHQEEIIAPDAIPIDTKDTSVAHTKTPGASVGDPGVTFADPVSNGGGGGGGGNIPPASAAGSKKSKAQSAKPASTAEVWDTNHPVHPKTAPVAADPADTPAPPPASTKGDPAIEHQNIPTGHGPEVVADAPADAPNELEVVHAPAATAPPPTVTPARTSSKGKNGVRWDPHIPAKEVANIPSRQAKSKNSTVADAPDTAASHQSVADPAGSAHGGDPAVVEGDAPDAAAHPVHPIPSGHQVPSGMHDTIANELPAGDEPAAPAATEHELKQTTSTPSSRLGKLRPSKSKENIKTTQPAGPSVVAVPISEHSQHSTVGEPADLNADDKDTRVANTVHVSRPPTEFVAEPDAGATMPGGKTSSSKLSKKKPVPTFVEGDMADPKVLADGHAVSGGDGPRGLPSRPGSAVNALPPDIPILEPVRLPDGTIAYLRSHQGPTATLPPAPMVSSHPAAGENADAATAAAGPGSHNSKLTKKDKSKTSEAAEGAAAAAAGGAAGGIGEKLMEEHVKDKERDKESIKSKNQSKNSQSHVPTESELGKGHCSVCCPNGPRIQGVPIEACKHQEGILGAGLAGEPAPPPAPPGATAPPIPSNASKKSAKFSKPPSVHQIPVEVPVGPGEEVTQEHIEGDQAVGNEAGAGGGSGTGEKGKGKLTKGSKKGSGASGTPEEEAMENARALAVKQKAAAEQAAAEAAERDARHKEKQAKQALADERHKQNVEALANLQKALDLLANENKTARTATDEKSKAQEKRRADKTTRDKKITEALDKLVAEREEAKKKQASEDKKPGTQAILDALKTAGDGQAAFLRKLATEIMEQNSNQHKGTQEAVKGAAREQVGFNLAGYLDDFSKALSGEVRVLLKEVGDLRESRRALYMELAELLLMKGRQSAGDLMAILPYPTAPPKNPNEKKKEEPKKDNKPNQQNQPKPPAGIPAWSSWGPMMNAPMPGRPLPQPGGPPPFAMNLSGGAVPPPPPPHGRPLPPV